MEEKSRAQTQKEVSMRSPKKNNIAELSPRRYDLSPGGTIWKNPHNLVEKTELSDCTVETVSSSSGGESRSFSWDVSLSDEDMDKSNTSRTKQRYMPSGASAQQQTTSGSSFKTDSISKTTAVTDNTTIYDDNATYSKRGLRRKQPSASTTIPSLPSNTSQSALTFLENLLCCGFDTTDDSKQVNTPEQERQKEEENDFLGKIITCHIMTCNCEGFTDCGGDYHDFENYNTLILLCKTGDLE